MCRDELLQKRGGCLKVVEDDVEDGVKDISLALLHGGVEDDKDRSNHFGATPAIRSVVHGGEQGDGGDSRQWAGATASDSTLDGTRRVESKVSVETVGGVALTGVGEGLLCI